VDQDEADPQEGVVKYLLDEEPLEGTLDDFFAVNSFDEDEVALMRALQSGETFTGGGGAWAEFTLTRVE